MEHAELVCALRTIMIIRYGKYLREFPAVRKWFGIPIFILMNIRKGTVLFEMAPKSTDVD